MELLGKFIQSVVKCVLPNPLVASPHEEATFYGFIRLNNVDNYAWMLVEQVLPCSDPHSQRGEEASDSP